MAAQIQSPTPAIRIHSISYKTNARAPNQSPTFCYFSKRAFCATRNLRTSRCSASFSIRAQPTNHQPASPPGVSLLTNHQGLQCSLPYGPPATAFARGSGVFTPTGGRYLSTIGPFHATFALATLRLSLKGHLGYA